MRCAIAIDLGGTHASVGVLCEKTLLTACEIPVEATKGLNVLLPRLRNASESLLRKQELEFRDCIGITLSLPSLVDFRSQRIVSANDKYPDAPAIDMHKWAQQTMGLPLVLENDARAALLGEWTAGAAQGCQDVVMLTLGTGVGCAVLANGTPFRTRQPQGGNLGGHIPVRLNGRRCSCGAFGCMESESSGWALPLIAAAMPCFEKSILAREAKLDFATVFTYSDAGDPVASALIEHCVHVWSLGAVGLVHVYGPERIVFGGGVLARAQDLLPRIKAYIAAHAWAPGGAVDVVAAALGNQAPLYASIALLDEFDRVQGKSLRK